MRLRSVLPTIVLLAVFSICARAQDKVDPRNFYQNIVDAGTGDFGLIVGDDATNLYFVCMRKTGTEGTPVSEPIAETIQGIKFYQQSFRTTAFRVKNFPFGPFTAVLYQCTKPKNYTWLKKFYRGGAVPSESLSTFLDNGVSDEIWSINNKTASVNDRKTDGLIDVRIPPGADIDKGMPLIGADGNIVGVFAEASNDKRFITAVDISALAQKLFSFAECKYFTLVEFGQLYNRCESEARQKSNEAQLAKDEERAAKKHFIDYGIYLDVMGGPLQIKTTSTADKPGSPIVPYGIQLYLNIDKSGKNRLTVKPRYGSYKEKFDDGLWSSPDRKFTVLSSSYKFAEIPIVFERQLGRSKDFSMAMGLGYSMGLAFNQAFVLKNNTTNTSVNRLFENTGRGTISRVMAELHFAELETVRLGLFYAYDLSAYPNDSYKLALSGTQYQPFADRNNAYYIGLEIAIRLRGNWGLQMK